MTLLAMYRHIEEGMRCCCSDVNLYVWLYLHHCSIMLTGKGQSRVIGQYVQLERGVFWLLNACARGHSQNIALRMCKLCCPGVLLQV